MGKYYAHSDRRLTFGYRFTAMLTRNEPRLSIELAEGTVASVRGEHAPRVFTN